ncbi:MAG: glycosyltransferase [bacterium]
MVSLGKKCNGSNPTTSFSLNPQSPISNLQSRERVRPWGFVLPALRLLRQERPDVAAVHFGNELPTLVVSLLSKVAMRNPPRWVWEQDQQIQDPGFIGKRLSRLRLLSLVADQFLAVYEGGRQSMLKRGIPAKKITVIHNSVALYTPTRPKGWLRQGLGMESSGRLAVSRGQSEGNVGGALRAATDPSGNTNLNMDVQDTQDKELGDSNPELSCKSCTSMLTPSCPEHVIAPDEVLLITNGSLIPRKRIDFILKACAQLRGRKVPLGKGFIGGRKGEKGSLEIGFIRENELEHSNLSSLPNDTNETNLPLSLFPSNETNATNSPLPPPWRLLIIGEGPERDRLGALATELGIADRVHFLGLRNDVREILPECDIYLHASKAETCTYAVTESMAAGIPAVMLNAGAAKEQIENGKSGFVFDEVDPIPFAACLSELMADSDRRAEMGKLAKSRWEALFRVERAAACYHELYMNGAKYRGSVVG